ncbi:MAG TPA: hypothetical protein PK680_09335 [Novosphingobium sp.]|nr:hypothetical protein [Novosphingobium sp.]HQA18571.1 hypothetical protein [Novosphingobium sp.]
MNPDENEARKRFLFLSLIRIGGAVFLTLGLMILGGKVRMQQELGLPFALIGLAGFLLVPVWLAKRWKSPRP